MKALDKIDAIHDAMLGNPAMHEWLGEIEELRADVAELIEAAISGREQLRDAARLLRGDDKLNCQVISDHLDAAIAAMGGKA